MLARLAALYGEAPSRIVVSLAPEKWDALAELMGQHGVPLTRLGVVGGDRLRFAETIDAPIAVLYDAWRGGLRRALEA